MYNESRAPLNGQLLNGGGDAGVGVRSQLTVDPPRLPLPPDFMNTDRVKHEAVDSSSHRQNNHGGAPVQCVPGRDNFTPRLQSVFNSSGTLGSLSANETQDKA